MKKIEVKFFKTYNAIIAGLLTIIGFASSCDSKDEYGTPSAKFIVNGNVKSSVTEQAIENIRVIMQGDTTFTDKDGKYQVSNNWESPVDQTFTLRYQDIDGESNTEFEDLDTIVEFKDPKFTDGDGDWYSGETSKEFNVKLTPKK